MATLLLHDNVEFDDQVVYAAGNAYTNCEFRRCTIIVMGNPSHFEHCSFTSCIWHINIVIHDSESLAAFLSLAQDTIGRSLPHAPSSPADPQPPMPADSQP